MTMGWKAIACAVTLGVGAVVAASAQTPTTADQTLDGTYSADQARRGRAVYDSKCASCHDGGAMGPELWGDPFLAQWDGKSLATFFTRIQPGRQSANDERYTVGQHQPHNVAFGRPDCHAHADLVAALTGQMRYACKHRLRQAVYHWARTSIQHDHAARAYYEALRARGHHHARALRSVADRWLRILVAMLTTRTLYDPSRLRSSASATA
jgi:hypothetical protein